MANLDAIEATLEAHIANSDNKNLLFSQELRQLWGAVNGKASYTVTWALVGVMAALLGIIYASQLDMQKGQARIESTVSKIEGTIAPLNFELKK